MVKAVLKLEQIASTPQSAKIRDTVVSTVSSSKIRDLTAEVTSIFTQVHVPHLSNPTSNPTVQGWTTEDKDDWSDSPTRQPLLLYRHRFSWGRDKEELFTTLLLGDDGARWGDLGRNSGEIIYERLYPVSASTTVRSIKLEASAKVSDILTSKSNNLTRITHLPEVEGEVDITQFPFLITALPEPFSEKNPVNTDVFIRISNFTTPVNSSTIVLYINEIQRTVSIVEFFGGLGGFDITWTNDQEFEYDAQVNVRLEFRDSDAPSHLFVIRYPFFTVPDLAPPRVINLVPANDVVDVSVAGPIQFDIVDFENGVDITTLSLYVNNALVVDGEDGQLEYFEIEDGYTVRFTPADPWAYGDLIPVAIFVKDTSIHKNEQFFVYSFTTEVSAEPRVINQNPEACAVDVKTGSDVIVDVIDGGHGLEKESIVFAVDDIEEGDAVRIPIVHRDD